MNDNVFMQAALSKWRFPTTKGELQSEDLFDLSLQALNSLAKGLNKKIKDLAGEESFLTSSSQSTGEVLATKQLELVVAIIRHKEAENEKKAAKADRDAKKAHLTSLLLKKTEQEWEGKSKEEIEKMLAEL